MSGPIDERLLSAERIIIEFFEDMVPKILNLNQQRCDEYAKGLVDSSDIQPAENQGARSYTVVCASKGKAVQFRLKPFKRPILILGCQIYGNQVPKIEICGEFLTLPVYLSNMIPGRAHILQETPRRNFPLAREKRTVMDLAKFLAKATYHPQPRSMIRKDSWTRTITKKLKSLLEHPNLKTLAPEIYKRAEDLLPWIYLIRRLPAVLCHYDFVEDNIFVNESGTVTGVIDFNKAGIESFGMNIYGLYEGFLGMMEGGHWSFYNELVATDAEAGDDENGNPHEVLQSVEPDDTDADGNGNPHPSKAKPDREVLEAESPNAEAEAEADDNGNSHPPKAKTDREVLEEIFWEIPDDDSANPHPPGVKTDREVLEAAFWEIPDAEADANADANAHANAHANAAANAAANASANVNTNPDADADNGNSGPPRATTTREVLEAAFWTTLWTNLAPGVRCQRLAIGVAINVGIISRYFVDEMLERIDPKNPAHMRSLDHARGILEAIPMDFLVVPAGLEVPEDRVESISRYLGNLLRFLK